MIFRPRANSKRRPRKCPRDAVFMRPSLSTILIRYYGVTLLRPRQLNTNYAQVGRVVNNGNSNSGRQRVTLFKTRRIFRKIIITIISYDEGGPCNNNYNLVLWYICVRVCVCMRAPVFLQRALYYAK